MPTGIRDLYAYHRWANRRILAAAAALPDEARTRDLGSSFPSIHATLAHILSADWIWLQRWHGTSPTAFPDPSELEDWERLLLRWDEVEREQSAFVERLGAAELEAPLAYRNTRGTPFTAPLETLMRHVVQHAGYHRGQVVTMLRQLGAEAPATDLVLHHHEELAGRDPGRPST